MLLSELGTDPRGALGLVLLSDFTKTPEGTLEIIGMLRNATRLLEHRYAVQIGERHTEPPQFLQPRKAAAKNKGGRPRGTGKNQRKQAAQPAMFGDPPPIDGIAGGAPADIAA